MTKYGQCNVLFNAKVNALNKNLHQFNETYLAYRAYWWNFRRNTGKTDDWTFSWKTFRILHQ